MHISDHQRIISNDNIPPARNKYITIRTNTDDQKDHVKQCFHNKHICDQLDIEFDIFMSMIQIIIKGFLSMRVKKLVQNVSLGVELDLMTRNISKLL